MTLKHFKIFYEVCREESITKAAANLNMAQPAVSTAIKELEAYYNVKLFERLNRKIYITNAGSYLLEYVDSILSQVEESKEVLQDLAASTRIRIGSNVSFGTQYLPDIITEFQSLHPEIPLFTMIQNSSQIENDLLHNKLDLAIMDNLSNNPSIKQTLLVSDHLVALYSPKLKLPSDKAPAFSKGKLNHEVSIHDFARIPLLLREPGSGNRDTVEIVFRQYGIHPYIALESISTQALISFCLRGYGILFLPASQAEPFLSSHRLIQLEIKDITFQRNYYFSILNKKYQTKSMRCFSDYLTQEFA